MWFDSELQYPYSKAPLQKEHSLKKQNLSVHWQEDFQIWIEEDLNSDLNENTRFVWHRAAPRDMVSDSVDVITYSSDGVLEYTSRKINFQWHFAYKQKWLKILH